MRSRGSTRLLVAGVGCVAALGASTLAAGAQTGEEPEVDEVRGYAAGLYLSAWSTGDEVDEEFEVGPTPEVTLPPEGGGPFTESLGLLETDELEDGDLATDLVVSTEGALGVDGYASSSATIENAGIGESQLAVADLIEVECSTDVADGPVGSTTILGGSVLNPDTQEVLEIEESLEPNTVVLDVEWGDDEGDGDFDQGSLRVVANEQIVDGDDITVIGLHVSLFLEFGVDGIVEGESGIELVVGEVSCGIDVEEPLTPDEPTTTTTVPADDVEPPADVVTVPVATPRFTG